MASKVTIGADPEAFLFNTVLGKCVPACGLIGGTKKDPKQIRKGLAKGYTIQEDNVMVEFNIPPARSVDQWMVSLATVTEEVTKYIQERGPYQLMFKSQYKFTNKELDSEQAMQFGCSRDFNAYADGLEFPVTDVRNVGQWRFAGGHIHVGYDASGIPPFVAAAFADVFIGMKMIGLDKQDKRRQLYGQPGRYRPTAYGLEYRTPSNWWLSDPNYIYLAGNAAMHYGMWLCTASTAKVRSAYQKMPWGAIRQAISESNLSLAGQVQNYIDTEDLLGDY